MILKSSKLFTFVRYSLIILISTFLSFVLLEVTIRFLAPQNIKTTYINNKSLAIEDPVLGFVYRPNAEAIIETPEFTVEYKINKYGMRDESVHPNPKSPDVTRILLLGDSFALGAGNDYDKIWPVIFERNLLEMGYNVDVVKAGVTAYDTRSEVLYLERLFPEYNPDIVILTFLPNDLFANTPTYEKQNDFAVQSFADEQKTEIQAITLTKRFLLSSDSLYVRLYLSTARLEYFQFPMSEKLQHQVTVTKDLLSRGGKYTKDKGAKFIVLSIPQEFQILMKARGYQFDKVDVDAIDGIFLEFATDEGFMWVSTLTALAEKYQSEQKDLYFRLDGHLNNNGNQFVGDYFSERFIELFKSQMINHN